MKLDNPFLNQYQKEVQDIESWSDLFRYTIELAKKETHCGTLAKFKNIETHYDDNKGFGIAKFAPFPLITDQEEFYINAYFFDKNSDPENKQEEEQFKENKVYCLMFMDYNFIYCLNNNVIMKTNDTDIHSLTYAIVLKTM